MVLLGEQTISVKRYTGGTYTGGRFTPGTESIINITASIQPTSGNEKTDLQENPTLESKDLQGSIRIYTTYQLKTIESDATTEPDILQYNNREYEIFQVGNWNKLNLQHNKYIGVLLP